MVYVLNPLHDSRWAELVERHPAATVFHTASWLDALRRTYGYEPLAYTTSPPDAPILTNGIPFCRITSWLTGRRLVSLPFTDHCEPLVDEARDRGAILEAVRECARRERLKYVELRPLTPRRWEGEMQASSAYAHHRLDLRPECDALFRAFHKSSIQRRVRRAEREGVTCESGTALRHVTAFRELMFQTRRRHGLPPQPAEWFGNLVSCLADRLAIRLAIKEGRAIAGILTLRHGNTVVYKYGCSDAAFHQLGAMPFLFWTLMCDVRSAGATSIDLGRSDLENDGLILFKERLGAVPSALTYLREPGARPPGWKRAGACRRVARGLVKRLPRPVLEMSGRLLYKHAG